MADPTSVWSEVMEFLGLSKKQGLHKKPRPLRPMSRDATDQFRAQAHNAEVEKMLSRPGAMILDTPVSRALTEKEMMERFDETGIPQRPGLTIQESDLPKGTLTGRAIGQKPRKRR